MLKATEQMVSGGDEDLLEANLRDAGLRDDECLSKAKEMAEAGNVEITTIVKHAKKKSLKDNFVMAFTDNLEVLANMGVNASELRVIAYCLKVMEYGNLLQFSQATACKDLDMKKSNMSTIFKSLKEKNVLVDVDGHLFVNSNLFTKGLSQSLNEEKRSNMRKAQSDHGGNFTKSW